MADDTKKGADAGQADAKPKRSKKMLLIVGPLLLLLLGGGGGAGWYFYSKSQAADGDESAETAKPVDSGKPKVFANLDPFVVNLADEGGDRLIQLGVVLEVTDAKIAAEVTTQMPAVRNAILLLLSSRQSTELLTLPGKQSLATDIALATGGVLGWKAPTTAAEADPRPRKVKADAQGSNDEADATKAADEATAAADEDDEDKPRKSKKKASPKVPHPPNPVAAVHFSQFLVQ
jgi:flagellar FliL protein